MVSRKDFFKIALRETVGLFESALAGPATPPEPTPAPSPAKDSLLADDALFYEAMTLGIDPSTVDAVRLRELVHAARRMATPETD